MPFIAAIALVGLVGWPFGDDDTGTGSTASQAAVAVADPSAPR